MFFSTLIIVVIIFILIKFINYAKRVNIASKIKGPRGLPFIGYYKIFTLPADDLLIHLITLSKQFEGFFKLWIGPELWAVVYDPKIAEVILSDQKLMKSNDYKFLKPWLGNGLLINEGKSWFTKRRAITPAFHFNIIEDFIEIFIRQTNILIEKLRTQDNVNVNVAPLLLRLAFDNIIESAMGIQMNTEMNSILDYIKANQNISEIAYKRMFNPFLANDLIFWLTKDYNKFNNSLKIVHDTNRKIISQRRNELKKVIDENAQRINHVQNETDEEEEIMQFGKKKKKITLLDILLQISINGKPLSDEEIEDEVSTFMFAGHDTTGTALSFLFYNIAKYAHVQEKLNEEIFNVFGEYENCEITMQKLNDLKYLDLVIKESMRIYTTVPFIGRQILEDYEIDKIKFPSNTNVSLFVYGMCHRDDLFPQPNEFNPERFDRQTATAKTEQINPFAFIPFSAGHRNCIGQRFAIFEMKTVTTLILQNFHIQLTNPNERLILMEGIVLKSKNGINLKFTPKKRENNVI